MIYLNSKPYKTLGSGYITYILESAEAILYRLDGGHRSASMNYTVVVSKNSPGYFPIDTLEYPETKLDPLMKYDAAEVKGDIHRSGDTYKLVNVQTSMKNLEKVLPAWLSFDIKLALRSIAIERFNEIQRTQMQPDKNQIGLIRRKP